MIVTQPVDQLTAIPGSDVTFSVFALGDELLYQWHKDGNVILDEPDMYSGTQSASLTVLSVSDPLDQGEFRVQIVNIAGTVVSAGVQLQIVCEF